MGQNESLKLSDIRRIFRLVGEVRELGSDPGRWRVHMVRRLQAMMDAEIVISSEVHFCRDADGSMRVVDLGWGCDSEQNTWQIRNDQPEVPEAYWVHANAGEVNEKAGTQSLVPVTPDRKLYGGSCFIMSQCALPHAGAVDQLGVHRSSVAQPYMHAEHRLLRLFHLELGRLWRRDAIQRAKDPALDLPPRLSQTLAALLAGDSEKQIAIKLNLSPHTIHNYVKALHQRFDVSSRGELLAKAGKNKSNFMPHLSDPRQ
jgi:DNA-binding CsgD family transcriptional regulator